VWQTEQPVCTHFSDQEPLLTHALRFIVAALVVLYFAFLLPHFSILGFWTAIALAVCIAVAGWLVEAAAVRRQATPYTRGLAGFVATVVVLFGAQFVAPHVHVSATAAVFAGLIVGVIDAFIPIQLG
jgi:putative membrane protein